MPKLKPLKCTVCGREFLYEHCLNCDSYYDYSCACKECDGIDLCGKEITRKEVFIFR
jgi:hypothetical protein